MNFEDWIFSLHLVMAATLVGSLVMSWIVLVALYRVQEADATLSLNRVVMVATALTVVGLFGAIALGIWTAILREAYGLSNGWVIGAIVLWCIATVALLRAFFEYAKRVAKARALVASGERGPNAELGALNRASTELLLRAVGSLAIVLIVIDMLWKPGA